MRLLRYVGPNVADVEVAKKESTTDTGVLSQLRTSRFEVVKVLVVSPRTLAIVSPWGKPNEFVRFQLAVSRLVRVRYP
jgi:hypothetical protein